jgi:molybdopterin synthase catalytic subunit
MNRFKFYRKAPNLEACRAEISSPEAGACVSFEGWVRDHNEGRGVTRLEYEAYETLGVKEGEKILAEALSRFGAGAALCVHGLGALEVGDLAVWVGVSSPHRDEAFAACRYIIDEVKQRVPIWKKETYVDGDSGWVNCERCAVHEHAVDG